jgi:outer membrane protein assembly factor BamB
METRYDFGEGSSPALHGDTLVLIWDHEGESFIVALDKRTGKDLWRKQREEQTNWTTPLIVEVGGRAQVITSATGAVRSYDLETGDIVWHTKGMTLNAIPSPVYADGIVYLMSGFRGNALKAIRLADAKGDIAEGGALVWEHAADTPYVPSPLLYDGVLYFLKSNNGILSAFDAKTGKAHYGPQRVEPLTNVYASPVGAGGRVYITDRRGATVVVKAGPAYEVLATNQLDDAIDASAAIVDGEIYFRGKSLYCIAAK